MRFIVKYEKLNYLIIFYYVVSEAREGREGEDQGEIYLIRRCCYGCVAASTHRAKVNILLGRVSNIYDLNPTTYILKIAKS